MTRPTLLTAVLLVFALTADAQQVRYRSAENVYLDQGSAAGIKVGDRFEIVRANAVIATVEVIFVAERSASAKILTETTTVQTGDAFRRPGSSGAAGSQPAEAPTEGTRRAESPLHRDEGGDQRHRSTLFSLSGTATFDYESGELHDRTLGRLSLRARNIAALPLHARVRARASSEHRESALISGTVPTSETRNRIYEASLAYEGERLGIRAGRLGNTPYVGLGYLDGALVRVTVTDFLEAGAFGGFQPDIRELSFDADATKFGGFVRVFTDASDLIVSAATVEDSAFVAVDGRYTPTERFSLFAYGRIGDETLNAMAGVVTQLSPRQNVTVSYERVAVGPDDDLRTPDQRIDDFLRQGIRVTYRGPYAHLGAGIRDGDDATTYSATAGLSHPNLLGLYTGISATGFSSDLSDGLFAQLRAGRRFGAGHNVELSAGALLVDESAIDDISTTAWVRGAVWIELPYDLFTRAEVEFTSGDGPAGHRLTLGAGYRF